MQDADAPKPIVLVQNETPAAALSLAPAPQSPATTAQLRAEQQSPRTVAPFDPSHFDKYVGYYELAPNLLFNITRDGGKFHAQFANAPTVELFPESETKFFETVAAAQLSFNADGRGKVMGLVFHADGREQPAPRITDDAARALQSALASHIKSNAPSAGTEAAVWTWLLAMQAGKPNYDDMTPQLAAFTRAGLPKTSQMLKAFGAPKAIAFVRVDLRGNDVFRVDLEHATVEVKVAPLTADGRMTMRAWSAAPFGPDDRARYDADVTLPQDQPAVRPARVLTETARNPQNFVLKLDMVNLGQNGWNGDANFTLTACPQASCLRLSGPIKIVEDRQRHVTEGFYPVTGSPCVVHFEQMIRRGMDSGDYRLTLVSKDGAGKGCAALPADLQGVYRETSGGYATP